MESRKRCIIPKLKPPASENDLRVISKTPFLSKLLEVFICEWLLKVISPYLDQDQYGLKGSSITHYLINFLDFIYCSLDSSKPTAVIAAFIDLSKAFNRVDHNILIEDLFAMNCPAWLLRILASFLSDRKLVLEYNGVLAAPKNLPGGTPAGCLLGQIFFIVKFNSALLRPEIPRNLLSLSKTKKAKYMDDASAAVSIPLDSLLVTDLVKRPMPLSYSERSKQILPNTNNILQMYLNDIEQFAKKNNMKINMTKTKVMKFSRVSNMDFPLEVAFSNNVNLEVKNKMKLLGVIINDRLKWDDNTDYISEKARKKIWLLRAMRKSGLTLNQLKDAYIKEVRTLLELTVPVWSSGLTLKHSVQIECRKLL